MPNSSEAVQAFLGLHRIAFVGVSREPAHFSRTLFHEFIRRGYDIVPVNPASDEIEGRRAYSTVAAIEPPVQGALLMTPATASERAVRDCEAAGVKRIWLFRGGGTGAVSPEAVAFGCDHGMQMVAGECPFMFLPNSGWFHAAHGLIRKIRGKYPN